MPSLKSISGSALGSFALLASTVIGGAPESCPANGPLSCQNTTAVANTCCFNAPGGEMLQTQFWDTSPATGPDDSWTVHGLWPDKCDGTYDANCDSKRAYTNITAILNSFGKTDLLTYMQKYWKDYQGNDESFWEHEWGKHGTCISTLQPDCYTDYKPTQEVPDYFQRAVDLFKTLDTYKFLSDAGITPSSSKTYSLSSVQAALKAAVGVDVIVQCSGSELNEAWYYYNVRGSVQTGQFVHVGPDRGGKSDCPSTIKYLPKSGGGGTDPPPGGGTPFQGSGYLTVLAGGSENGCLISAGTWYTTGTCATYTADVAPNDNGFTLSSSKGNCGVSGGKFACGSGVTGGTVFGSSGGYLTYGGSDAFSADAVASGSTQETVYTGSTGSVDLQIRWQSV